MFQFESVSYMCVWLAATVTMNMALWRSKRRPVSLNWMATCIHMDVCVCIYAPNHQCSSLNCWHLEFKASSFSSRQKYPDLHLFFLPALFRCPISTPGAEKKNHFRPQSSKTHVKLSLDTDHLKSFDFSFRSFGVDFFETLRLGNKHRCRWSFVIGSVLPARWTAVC